MHAAMHGNDSMHSGTMGCMGGNDEMHMMMCSMNADDMDADNDGVCDLCGMPVEACNKMMGEHDG